MEEPPSCFSLAESIDTSSAILRGDTVLLVLGMTNLLPYNQSAPAIELQQSEKLCNHGKSVTYRESCYAARWI